MIDVSSLSGDCLSFLLDISFKSLALGLLACLWLGIGRVRRPARRHAVWATVVCGMLGVPLLSLTMPGVMLPLLPSDSRGKALATVGSMAAGSPPAVAANRSQAGETAVGPEESIRRAGLSAPAAGEVRQPQYRERDCRGWTLHFWDTRSASFCCWVGCWSDLPAAGGSSVEAGCSRSSRSGRAAHPRSSALWRISALRSGSARPCQSL